jgi:predicted nucleic acid-binding protein
LPILDTVVLFGAADPKDPAHEKSVAHLARLNDPTYYLAGFAMVEFDIVMKSRGLSYKERMMRHALLARDYPATTVKIRPLTPQVFYLAATIEGEDKIDYFDAGVAAEAMNLDGRVVSRDRVFEKLQGVKKTW